MVRFSCFQAHNHSHKQIVCGPSKTVHLSAEEIKTTLENAPENGAPMNFSNLEEGDALNNKSNHASNSSPVDTENRCYADCDFAVIKNAQIRKSQSLGSGLNSKDRALYSDYSDDDAENNFSCDGSSKDEELIVSDSVRVNSNFATNDSIFSIGQRSEKEAAKEDADLSGSCDSGACTPRLVKSTSLPSIRSPHLHSSYIFPCSKSVGDLNTLDSQKMHVAHGVNMERTGEAEASFDHCDELPTKGTRLNRIEEWVSNLQHCSPVEESNEFSLCDDHELTEDTKAVLEESSSKKLEVKVNPGMEVAKRYITSLNASSTAAHLTNLGLVVIPFLSAFVSLKVLNLSGNSIARITSGALPRGLHVLNLSRNHISTIEGLRDLTRLRVLDLSYNRILRIGHGLACCSSIKELYLAGNKISEVEGLHRLLKLTVLDLRFNKISTTKCLGQLAANYRCLQSLSLEGNPAQKNVGDEQLKKYAQSLLPQLAYHNKQSIKIGAIKDTSDRSGRLGMGARQIERGPRVEVKTARRKSQVVVSQRSSRSRRGVVAPGGVKTTTDGNQLAESGRKLMSVGSDSFICRSRSEGTLGTL